ncbi:phosphatase PAP2 family protein [Micromonospora sp. SH-82]|uniref:phosphatase PAP2 family protein n=1 Tax=Micromonospora sp. SH-82 TaxID=3132938 RepID=UPI003EB96C7F
MFHTSVTDVPDISTDLYQDVVEFADANPTAAQWFMVHFTEASIILLGLLLLFAAWRRLGGSPGDKALVLVVPATVVFAYGLSEGLKLVITQSRPCQVLTDVAIVASECPTVGDWSFPSNHSTIAGALAAGTYLLHRTLGWYALPIAAFSAFSRVYVGVHYPHDALVGVILGATVVLLLAPLLVTPTTNLIRRRTHRSQQPVPTHTPH